MAFLNFFFGSKKSSCCTKNPIIDPIFSLDYYFSVLEETKSPLNGFLSTQIKKLWVKSFKKNKTDQSELTLRILATAMQLKVPPAFC